MKVNGIEKTPTNVFSIICLLCYSYNFRLRNHPYLQSENNYIMKTGRICSRWMILTLNFFNYKCWCFDIIFLLARKLKTQLPRSLKNPTTSYLNVSTSLWSAIFRTWKTSGKFVLVQAIQSCSRILSAAPTMWAYQLGCHPWWGRWLWSTRGWWTTRWWGTVQRAGWRSRISVCWLLQRRKVGRWESWTFLKTFFKKQFPGGWTVLCRVRRSPG